MALVAQAGGPEPALPVVGVGPGGGRPGDPRPELLVPLDEPLRVLAELRHPLVGLERGEQVVAVGDGLLDHPVLEGLVDQVEQRLGVGRVAAPGGPPGADVRLLGLAPLGHLDEVEVPLDRLPVGEQVGVAQRVVQGEGPRRVLPAAGSRRDVGGRTG